MNWKGADKKPLNLKEKPKSRPRTLLPNLVHKRYYWLARKKRKEEEEEKKETSSNIPSKPKAQLPRGKKGKLKKMKEKYADQDEEDRQLAMEFLAVLLLLLLCKQRAS